MHSTVAREPGQVPRSVDGVLRARRRVRIVKAMPLPQRGGRDLRVLTGLLGSTPVGGEILCQARVNGFPASGMLCSIKWCNSEASYLAAFLDSRSRKHQDPWGQSSRHRWMNVQTSTSNARSPFRRKMVSPFDPTDLRVRLEPAHRHVLDVALTRARALHPSHARRERDHRREPTALRERRYLRSFAVVALRPIGARMNADNVAEGQDVRIRIGVDPAAGGCNKTFPFLVDLTVASQTPGMLEGNKRSGNTLGPTLPPLRTVRLESCDDSALETYKTVENETDEGERAATFRLSNLRRASATDQPAERHNKGPMT